MSPMYGHPNFHQDSAEDSSESNRYEETGALTEMAFWYMIVLIAMLLLWLVLFFCLRIISLRQKTRNPQQRRMYVGSRQRQSIAQPEPTIYVSPSNLPPPPKYECMAPPSYEEVVGVHYPNYQITAVQPIAQPISTALAQGSNSTQVTQANNEAAVTSITVTSEPRRTSVTVARS